MIKMQPSRFAVLKIENDSEEEAEKSTKIKFKTKSKSSSSKEERKRKPMKKSQVLADEPIEEIKQSETNEEGDFSAEDMTRALAESLKFLKEPDQLSRKKEDPDKPSTSRSPLYGEVPEPDPLATVLKCADGTNEIFISLLQDQITKLNSELLVEKDKVLRATHGEQKYKERYMKLLNLLHDVELKEQVLNLHEIERRERIITEQSTQIKNQQDQLEKLKDQLMKVNKSVDA